MVAGPLVRASSKRANGSHWLACPVLLPMQLLEPGTEVASHSAWLNTLHVQICLCHELSILSEESIHPLLACCICILVGVDVEGDLRRCWLQLVVEDPHIVVEGTRVVNELDQDVGDGPSLATMLGVGVLVC